MSNPLMGMMGGMPGGNSPFGMIQRMMGMMQNTQNPGAMLQNMAQSNPNIKKAKLADRDRDLQTAYWQISQVSQTNNIIDAVRPTPKPAYMSCSPYFAYNAFGNGCCASGNVM